MCKYSYGFMFLKGIIKHSVSEETKIEIPGNLKK